MHCLSGLTQYRFDSKDRGSRSKATWLLFDGQQATATIPIHCGFAHDEYVICCGSAHAVLCSPYSQRASLLIVFSSTIDTNNTLFVQMIAASFRLLTKQLGKQCTCGLLGSPLLAPTHLRQRLLVLLGFLQMLAAVGAVERDTFTMVSRGHRDVSGYVLRWTRHHLADSG